MTTKWKKRGQALRDGVPNLTIKAPGATNTAVPGPGRPVPKGTRGTVYVSRNPMHDTLPLHQETSGDPIRTQLKQRGVA
jgi:hypothetical protein